MERMSLSAVSRLHQHLHSHAHIQSVNAMAVKECCPACSTVRLQGINLMLQGYSSERAAWMPVCAENWDNDYGRDVCEMMGYKRW